VDLLLALERLLDRGVEDDLAGFPDVGAGAIAFDEGEDRVVGDLDRAGGADLDLRAGLGGLEGTGNERVPVSAGGGFAGESPPLRSNRAFESPACSWYGMAIGCCPWEDDSP
jgi:hypothetical protein